MTLTTLTVLPSSATQHPPSANPVSGFADGETSFPTVNTVPVDLLARSRLRREVRQIEVQAFGWPRLLFGVWPTITQPYKYLTAAYLAEPDAPSGHTPKLVGYCLTLRKKTHLSQTEGLPSDAGKPANAHYVESVGVLHHYRRRGIGRALVRCACAGNEVTWLHVRQSNTSAIGLYESLGFVERQVAEGFYKNNGENALVMVLEGSCV